VPPKGTSNGLLLYLSLVRFLCRIYFEVEAEWVMLATDQRRYIYIVASICMMWADCCFDVVCSGFNLSHPSSIDCCMYDAKFAAVLGFVLRLRLCFNQREHSWSPPGPPPPHLLRLDEARFGQWEQGCMIQTQRDKAWYQVTFTNKVEVCVTWLLYFGRWRRDVLPPSMSIVSIATPPIGGTEVDTRT
jgi:hypothetical protein